MDNVISFTPAELVAFITAIGGAIVTIGAATTAAYYTMSKSVRRKTGYIGKEFFHSFKIITIN